MNPEQFERIKKALAAHGVLNLPPVAELLAFAQEAGGKRLRISGRFTEFWEMYPRKTNMDAAAADWVSLVTAANEQEVFRCLARYLVSKDVASGAVAQLGSWNGKLGWLVQCSKDNWKSDWPKAAQERAGNSKVAKIEAAGW